MKVWKLAYLDTTQSLYELYNNIEILTEQGLKDRLRQAIDEEQLNCATYDEFVLDNETDTNAMATDTIVKIFKFDGYEIDTMEL